ncbi:MAG: DUF547 domain-containing protein [Syntrophobacteraceae bacterium]
MGARGFRSGIIGVFFLLGVFCGGEVRAAGEVDHGIYGRLLAKYVAGGTVDYRGLKTEERTLDEYLGLIEQTKTGDLPPKEQLAFYINAYNACTLKLVLGGYPGVKSIKELGGVFSSPFKKKICKIDGRPLSLDEIEHEIIRPRFKDPRVHFALNCASKGCPPLASGPYRGAALDGWLDEAARAFVNDPSRYRLDGGKLSVSMIFKWYAPDFGDGALGFIRKYADGDLGRTLTAGGDRIKVGYLDYDWSLNGK